LLQRTKRVGEICLAQMRDENRAPYRYGEDYPPAFNLLSQQAIGRPMAEHASPSIVLNGLNEIYVFTPAPRRRGSFQGPKPGFKANSIESENETERRQELQREIQRLILPRGSFHKEEVPDLFFRRLDAHHNSPEAIVCPMTPHEDAMIFAKRMAAVKQNATPGMLVLPKGACESAAEAEQRFKLCQKCPALVMPRGKHESPEQFKKRLELQAGSAFTLMPRSDGEPPEQFVTRCKLAAQCQEEIPAYDSERETADGYADRLLAQQEQPEIAISPEDHDLVDRLASLLRPKPALPPKPPPEREPEPTPEPEPEPEPQPEPEPEPEPQPKPEPEPEPEPEPKKPPSLAPTPVPITAAPEKPPQPDAETVDLATVGFMSLKKMLLARGVPADIVSKAPNKFMLKEVAEKHGCNITFS